VFILLLALADLSFNVYLITFALSLFGIAAFCFIPLNADFPLGTNLKDYTPWYKDALVKVVAVLCSIRVYVYIV
jgi:hypothetical protein